MRSISIVALPLLIAVGGAAQGQTPPSSHEHLQAAPQHPAKAGEQGCEQMMREMHEMHQMMTEMMKMHQGMAAHSSHDAVKEKPRPEPD
jgi:hypothetical protein